MAVYLAYALVLSHVALGVLQFETSPILVGVLFAGAGILLGLQLIAAIRERAADQPVGKAEQPSDGTGGAGYIEVCSVSDLPEKGARIASIGGERVAVFRYDGKVSAISNVCKHQNGPLGEGRIVNGCVVCPWHGYEYDPATGASPPPFTETVPTFRVRVDGDRVLVDPRPNPPGTRVEPAVLGESAVDEVEADPAGFYVGYRPTTSSVIARALRPALIALFVLAAAIPLVLVGAQQRFSDAVFEFGTVREFEGVVSTDPYPVLHVESGDGGDVEAGPHQLVVFGKRGGQQAVAGRDGDRVATSGQLIFRSTGRMIELSEDLELSADEGAKEGSGASRSLGRHRLRGEIVDSKCYLGVMKPGRGKPHRACAARCISGGVAPAFVVSDETGATRQLLLAGSDGRALNSEVLAWVAEPLEIEGEVFETRGVLSLRAEPKTFLRWKEGSRAEGQPKDDGRSDETR